LEKQGWLPKLKQKSALKIEYRLNRCAKDLGGMFFLFVGEVIEDINLHIKLQFNSYSS